MVGSNLSKTYDVSFRNQPTRNKNCLWQPCLLTDRDEISNLYRGPSIDAAYQVLIHLAERFQRRRFFRNQPIRNKNGLWWPCLLTLFLLLSFLAHLAKGNANFCHHLASVVCRLLTFHILIFYSETPQANELKLGRKYLPYYLTYYSDSQSY
jgi:hypothetical protein